MSCTVSGLTVQKYPRLKWSGVRRLLTGVWLLLRVTAKVLSVLSVIPGPLLLISLSLTRCIIRWWRPRRLKLKCGSNLLESPCILPRNLPLMLLFGLNSINVLAQPKERTEELVNGQGRTCWCASWRCICCCCCSTRWASVSLYQVR